MHLEAVLHTEVYRRRDDVGAIVHGHPPYATAFAPPTPTCSTSPIDAVMFDRGLAVYDGTPDLITEPEQGVKVAQALGQHSVVLLRNHGVLVAHRDLPWMVLAAVTLERAVMLQSIAGTLGAARRSRRCSSTICSGASTTTAWSTSTGRPGYETCSGAASPKEWSRRR